ncbi:hypothetical protein NT6N_19980 [Oceaniferula spumae]|uniref:Transglutaminase-like domain-containing protein n=1 Tax=Oceaniferula spumae TaxID=2979115 RepID=A0AAT9FLY3_9BACT
MRSLTLIVAVAGAYALLRGWPGGPGLLLRSCLAVATLVAGLAIWGTRRKGEVRRARMFSLRKATLLDYFSLGAAIVFTEACFVALTSTLAGPAQEFALVVKERVSGIELEAGGTGNGASGNGEDLKFDGQQSGPWIFKPNTLERDLPKRSNHKPSNKPEVFVELENAEDAAKLLHSRIHLRAFAFSQFNGSSWSAAPTARTRLLAPIQFPNRTESNESEVIRHRVYHAANPTGQNVFTALHGAVSTDISELTQLAESLYLLPVSDDPTAGYNYIASSKPIHLSNLLDETLTPAVAADGELDLPSQLEEQLKQTALLFENKPDTASRLLALQHHLQDNYEYSLETTNENGANPLENFLYQEKRGYCEHFATAAAMLCRAMGVPSRIAYGWSGGKLYQAQNMFVFRAKDAHAWTEIKLQGHGWVVFDTTPPDDDAIPESHTAPDDEIAPDPEEALASDTSGDDSDSNDPGIGLGAGVNRVAIGIALGVVSLVALVFLILRYRGQAETAPDGRPLSHVQPSYLIHFKQACAALGHPMPLGRTLRQHIETLAKSNRAPEFADNLLAYHYGVLYGDAEKDTRTEKQLNRTIRKWRNTADSGAEVI